MARTHLILCHAPPHERDGRKHPGSSGNARVCLACSASWAWCRGANDGAEGRTLAALVPLVEHLRGRNINDLDGSTAAVMAQAEARMAAHRPLLGMESASWTRGSSSTLAARFSAILRLLEPARTPAHVSDSADQGRAPLTDVRGLLGRRVRAV